ncbi:MAG: CAP domain-containing protein [Pseudorhodobacter sp.]
MKALSVVVVCASLALAACGTGNQIRIGSDGRPLPQIYRISSEQEAKIPFRLLDSVNALRAAKGAQPLQFNALLNAAAATHSRDMAVQNRPWHFGSDGSSPLDRVNRVGYAGRLVGENISETFETELETLSAWMALADTREVIMDPLAREIGFSWFQEPSGKIWWTMVTGA